MSASKTQLFARTFAPYAQPFYGSTSTITYVDDFCGAGGSSQGLREAGLQLLQAANHNPKAIETHATNFPDADHLETDLMLYNMRHRPRPDVYWASPECTWHSPAGGRKRHTRQAMLDMFDEYVPNEAGERSRLTMMQVVAFAEAKRPRVVLVENVVEVAGWELFDTWLHAMDALGYDRQILCVSAAHVWSEFNAPAPQWRDRVYFVFYEKGMPFPDVQPRPWAVCPECGDLSRSRQAWKEPKKGTRRHKIGKYRQQYIYVCEHHPRIQVEPLVSPAMDALDLTDLGTRIGDRKKILAPATQRRIKVGAVMLGYFPELVTTAGNTWDAASRKHPNHGRPDAYYRAQGIDEPAPARTATQSEALVTPYLATVNHGGADDGRPARPEDGPMAARSTKLGEAMVHPFLSHQYGEIAGSERRNTDPTQQPLGTVVAGGGHHNLVTPMIVQRRDYDGADTSRVHSTGEEPLGARTATGRGIDGLVTPMIIQNYDHNGGDARRIKTTDKEPLGTVVANGRHEQLVTPFITRQYNPRGKNPGHLSTGIDEPMHAVTASGGNQALIVPAGGTWNDDARPTDEPMRTRTTREMEGLAAPPQFIDVARNNNRARDPENDAMAPVTTGQNQGLVTPDPYVTVARRNSHPHDVEADALAAVTAGGNHHELVTPFISKHHGGLNYKAIGHMNKPGTEPMPSVVTRPNISLVTPSRPPRPEIDMDAIDKIDISDWFFRMLNWREHANAQRFPTEYAFTGNSSENTLMAGNAVASNVAHYLGVLTRVAFGDLPMDILGYDLELVAS